MPFRAMGKPTQNAYIESFNGRFRPSRRMHAFVCQAMEECLNLNWFTTLAEAEKIIENCPGRLQPEPAPQFAELSNPGRVCRTQTLP